MKKMMVLLLIALVGCAKVCEILPVIAPTIPVSVCVGVTTPTPTPAP